MRALAAAALCAAIPAAFAQAGPARAVVEQKEALVRRLLNDSPAVVRIEASGNGEAKEYFRRARERHGKAVALLQAADLARAEGELNEAMWMAGKARQLVPDPMRRAIELRVQNRAMMRAIESLRASYRIHLARAQGLPRGAEAGDARLAGFDARLDEALSFANSEHVQEANAILHGVERDLVSALTAVLGSDTLDYAQRFETQAEELAYELSRNRSYRELLPVARAELRPGRDAADLMNRYAATSASLLERAEKSAARRDYAAALEAVRQATSYLQSALAAAGVTMPRDTTATASGGKP